MDMHQTKYFGYEGALQDSIRDVSIHEQVLWEFYRAADTNFF